VVLGAVPVLVESAGALPRLRCVKPPCCAPGVERRGGDERFVVVESEVVGVLEMGKHPGPTHVVGRFGGTECTSHLSVADTQGAQKTQGD